MIIEQLLTYLDYASGNNNYRRINAASQLSEIESLCQEIQTSVPESKIDGYYLLNTSPLGDILPPQPVLFVAEVKRFDDARVLHQKLWNTGDAPFIIILLPQEVRIYSGFNFKRDLSGTNEDGAFISIPAQPEEMDQKLADFKAYSIDSGLLWEHQSENLHREGKVDRQLLANLNDLDQELESRFKLAPNIRHALIGKYVYIRYLRDRGILTQEWLEIHNASFDEVFGENASRMGLKTLIDALEDRFNGMIFPVNLDENSSLTDDVVRLVASAFRGNQVRTGQLALFDLYDFRFIPVAMLASIYEQFLENRREIGAYYTPKPLAEYLFYEMEKYRPLKIGFNVLDPSCGSGTFLVTVFQQMIQLAQKGQPGKTLTPDQLVELLLHIYGVEREEDACNVAEFSLILALLSHIEPRELHKNETFRFPVLHNRQIFQCDFFDDTSTFVKFSFGFDWIIGNPPWMELQPGMAEGPVRDWISKNQRRRPVPDLRVSDAFCWRVTDFVAPDGLIGLLVPAKTLLNSKSGHFRRLFFVENQVFRVTNFANLRRILFPGTISPAATMIYRKRKLTLEDGRLDSTQTPIVHFAPFLANQRVIATTQQKEAWALTIYGNEVKLIEPEDAESGSIFPWKLAFWGGSRDARVLKRFENLFPKKLGQLLNEKRATWRLSEGPQLRDSSVSEQIEFVPDLEGRLCLDIKKLDGTGNRFFIDQACTFRLAKEKCYVRRGRKDRPVSVCRPPHILLHSSWNYVIFLADYLIIPPRQWGLASTDVADSDLFRAMSIYLSSTLVEYYLVFHTPSRGIERETLIIDDLKSLPIPNFSKGQISELANFQIDMSYREKSGKLDKTTIRSKIDDIVARVLNVPLSLMEHAQEFIQVKYSLNDGRVAGTNAVRFPKPDDLKVYGEILAQELDEVTLKKGIRHQIDINYSRDRRFILCLIRFIRSNEPITPNVLSDREEKIDRSWESLWGQVNEQFAQWVYIQRDLKIFEQGRIILCKPARLLDWTKSQAFADSDTLIADILLGMKGVKDDRTTNNAHPI